MEPRRHVRVDSAWVFPLRGHTGILRSLIERTLKMDLVRLLFAIILPPLGVFLQVGLRGAFWLNILLTLLGYLPGIIHAVWIIARR